MTDEKPPASKGQMDKRFTAACAVLASILPMYLEDDLDKAWRVAVKAADGLLEELARGDS